MLEKYCYAVSFEKELFLTNNSIPITLNVQIMISILYNIDSPFCFVGKIIKLCQLVPKRHLKDQMPTLLYIFQIWEVTDSTAPLIVAKRVLNTIVLVNRDV